MQEHPNTQSSLLLGAECRLHGNYASSHTLCGVQTVAAAHAKRAVGFFGADGRMRSFRASQAGVLSGATGTASHISTPAQRAFGAGEADPPDCSPLVLAPPSPYTPAGGRRRRARTHRGITRRHGRAARTGASMECTARARVAKAGGKEGWFGHLCTVLHRNNGVRARGLGWARASARHSAGKCRAESGRTPPKAGAVTAPSTFRGQIPSLS